MLTRAHTVPLALFFGFAVPTAIGLLWNDVGGAYVWGGFVSRIISKWHDLLDITKMTAFLRSLALHIPCELVRLILVVRLLTCLTLLCDRGWRIGMGYNLTLTRTHREERSWVPSRA